MTERLFSPREFATQVNLDSETVRRWLREGKVRGIAQEGDRRGWLIPGSEVVRILAERGVMGQVLDQLRDAAVLIDLATDRMVWWNRAAQQLFGYLEDDAPDDVTMLVPERFRAGLRTAMERYRTQDARDWLEADSPIEWHALQKSGSEVDVELTISALDDSAGRFVLAIVRDVTARNRRQRQTAAIDVDTRAILDATPEGLHLIDEHGRVVFANPAGATLLGYRPSELVGKRLHSLVHHSRLNGTPFPEDECPIVDAAGRCAEVGGDTVLWTKAGSPVCVEYKLRPVQHGQGHLSVLAFHDVTARKRAEDVLFDQAFHDPVTLLPNRRLFEDRVSHAIRTAERTRESLAVLVIRLGREAAPPALPDKALSDLAARMRAVVREVDTLARVGESEFGLLLT